MGCQETGKTGVFRRLFDVVVTRQRRLRVGINEQYPPVRVCYNGAQVGRKRSFPYAAPGGANGYFYNLRMFALPKSQPLRVAVSITANCGPLAQLAEHLTLNQVVRGSNP